MTLIIGVYGLPLSHRANSINERRRNPFEHRTVYLLDLSVDDGINLVNPGYNADGIAISPLTLSQHSPGNNRGFMEIWTLWWYLNYADRWWFQNWEDWAPQNVQKVWPKLTWLYISTIRITILGICICNFILNRLNLSKCNVTSNIFFFS